MVGVVVVVEIVVDGCAVAVVISADAIDAAGVILVCILVVVSAAVIGAEDRS